MPIHGDRPYFDVGLNSFYVNHPRAPFQYLISNFLRQAYVASQHYGTLVGIQNYSFNARDFETDTANRRTFQTGGVDYAGIGAWWYDIPLDMTHLVAWALYAIPTTSRFRVRHRLTATDTALTGCASNVGEMISEPQTGPPGNPNNLWNTGTAGQSTPWAGLTELPYIGWSIIRSHSVELALGTVAGYVQVRHEAQAVNLEVNTNNIVTTYMPLLSVCFAEQRFT